MVEQILQGQECLKNLECALVRYTDNDMNEVMQTFRKLAV